MTEVQSEIPRNFLLLEKFLKGVFYSHLKKIAELPAHHFHSEYKHNFSNPPLVLLYQKIDAVVACRESVGLVNFVDGELLDEAHYFKVETQFSSEFLKKLPRSTCILKNISWYNFLPMTGYMTKKEKDEIEAHNPSSLIQFAKSEPGLLGTNGKISAEKIKVLVTEDDFSEEDVEELKSAYSDVMQGASEIKYTRHF